MEVVTYLLNEPWLYATLMTTYGLSVLTVIIVILGENRNPVKSLAWVTILTLLPAVGLVLYFFFGRNVKNKRMISRRLKRRLRKLSSQPSPASVALRHPSTHLLAKAVNTMTGYTLCGGNSVEVFSQGEDKFAALLADLRSAREFINLQYYIFENDDIGTQIATILKQKASEGLKVRVIYDHVGSWHVRTKFFSDLCSHGVEAYPFFKVAFLPFASRVNWRNHRKIVVIDGRIGYVGGMNIADRYITGQPRFRLWRDCHLRIEGPGVAELQYSFARDWVFMGNPPLEQACTQTPCGSVALQMVTGGPMSQWNSLALTYIRAIGMAKRRIWIQTPYFMPPDPLLRALQAAALSGVDVRLMIPRRSDAMILSYASRSYIGECLQSGMKVYSFNAGMLHSKVMIIDDDLSSVGSTNFDFRSFEHNFECTELIYSDSVNHCLREQFLADQASSTRLLAEQWRQRTPGRRLLESLMRLLAPLL